MAAGTGVARSWLYVPGHRADLVAKALVGEAEAVVVDLEDAVAPGAKDTARAAVADLADAPRDRPLWVRMNAPDGDWGAADLEVLRVGPPSTGSASPRPPTPTPSPASPTGSDARCTCWWSPRSASSGPSRWPPRTPWSAAVSLGEADLAADLRVADRGALEWARQRIVVASRAAGLPSPLAPVWTDLPDLDGLAADSRVARDRGFWGRSVIHPRQIPVVHEAFSATADELARARALLDSLESAGARGETAYRDADGRFVDPAVVAGARTVVARAVLDRTGPDRAHPDVRETP